MKTYGKIKLAAVVVVCLIVMVAVLYMCHAAKSVTAGHQTEVVVTPTPVNLDSIRAIGQWSFLTVEMDEVVDTVDRGLFSSDRISVAYHGTLHYGINVAEARPGWVTIVGDTAVTVVLPPVKLLDDRFLDERNVKVYEGRDDMDFINKPTVRAALVRKAKAAMIRRGRENIPEARSKAETEVRRIFSQHGYKKIVVRFEDDNKK
ncbi:hypothetical protein PRLR6014_06070 [Prevotella lacticifex]|uniref:DUF4230 domain-containing protein n=1 Tax=Prevotella lacticifex TaxID=2854755 RepID=UPI001CC3970C|nr:DUF4230 domain-containing protein [Prevotella lacticifex]GJG64131.1 hypothetical protein PRLR6014_06070 [Prevotella lacticifex]